MKTPREIAEDTFKATTFEEAERIIETFEADARADERIKATADTLDKVSRTMVPREGGRS